MNLKMKKTSVVLTAIFGFALVLSGCGGGGGTSEPDATEPSGGRPTHQQKEITAGEAQTNRICG